MNWLSKGMDIFHVSAMLGHEHISTTEYYLRSNLKDKEAELRRIGFSDEEFKPFKPNTGHDEFIEALKRKTKLKEYRYDHRLICFRVEPYNQQLHPHCGHLL